MSISDLVKSLDLQPHPEGGWYRRTWTAEHRVETPHGSRATASAIIFLLNRDDEAAWHKVRFDELWLWHGPGELEIQLGGSGASPNVDAPAQVLSAARGAVQLLVPAGCWQRTVARGDHALASCIVSPEFTFEDWTLAE